VDIYTESHETDDDKAVVQATIEWPDLEVLFVKYFGKALGVAFANIGASTIFDY
jgi:hypothetical protein